MIANLIIIILAILIVGIQCVSAGMYFNAGYKKNGIVSIVIAAFWLVVIVLRLVLMTP